MWLPRFIKDLKLGNDIVLIDNQGKAFVTRNPLESWLTENDFEVIKYNTLDQRIKIKLSKTFVLDKEEHHMRLSDLLYPYRKEIKDGKCLYMNDLVKKHFENYLGYEFYEYCEYYYG